MEGDFCVYLWKNPGFVRACDTFLSSLQFSLYKAATFGEADNGKEEETPHFRQKRKRGRKKRPSGKLSNPVTFFPENPARIEILMGLLRRGVVNSLF